MKGRVILRGLRLAGIQYSIITIENIKLVIWATYDHLFPKSS
jgi:hypothetical protein